jgi:ketol-acid reductoisomerase
MADMFYDDDADLALIQGRNVAVLGYGSQGHAHALSLRDSGVDVRVGLLEGSRSRAKAESEGLRVVSPFEACEESDLVVVLAPDPAQRSLYAEAIEPNLVDGDALFFSHGFNIRYGYIVPPAGVDVAMVAPKGPGHLVRREFSEGRGRTRPGRRRAGRHRTAWPLTLSYAKAIGGTRAGASRPRSPRRPRRTCSASRRCSVAGRPRWSGGLRGLTEAGYQPEVAYFECLHELKLIVDLMYEGGIAKQRWSVSDTAEYGDYTSGPYIIDDSVKERMRNVLGNIQDGTWASEFIADQDAGATKFAEFRKRSEAHPIEETGRQLRTLMSWVKSHDDDYTEGTAAR